MDWYDYHTNILLAIAGAAALCSGLLLDIALLKVAGAVYLAWAVIERSQG